MYSGARQILFIDYTVMHRTRDAYLSPHYMSGVYRMITNSEHSGFASNNSLLGYREHFLRMAMPVIQCISWIKDTKYSKTSLHNS